MKNKPKFLWGNAIGIDPVLWFNKPKKFKYRESDNDYIPIDDTTTRRWWNGGKWIMPKMGLSFQSGECICFLSTSYEEVSNFTKMVKKMLKYNDYWQNSFLKELKSDYKRIYEKN